MSTLAYGALTRKRAEAPARRSTRDKPPGLRTYVDALAALVPAEILTVHAVVISQATKTSSGVTSITEPGPLAFFFWVFLALGVVLYLVGRRTFVPTGWDWARMFLAPVAFVGWSMLQPATAFDGVAPGFDEGWRWALGLTIALAVGIAAALLGADADKQPAGNS